VFCGALDEVRAVQAVNPNRGVQGSVVEIDNWTEIPNEEVFLGSEFESALNDFI